MTAVGRTAFSECESCRVREGKGPNRALRLMAESGDSRNCAPGLENCAFDRVRLLRELEVIVRRIRSFNST